CDTGRISPIQFCYIFIWVTPFFEMCSYAKSCYDMFDFVLELHKGIVIQMIPLVMRDDENVNLGHVFSRIAVLAIESTDTETHGGGIFAEYRVNENFFPIQL